MLPGYERNIYAVLRTSNGKCFEDRKIPRDYGKVPRYHGPFVVLQKKFGGVLEKIRKIRRLLESESLKAKFEESIKISNLTLDPSTLLQSKILGNSDLKDNI